MLWMDGVVHREGLLEAKKHFGTFKKLAKVLCVKPQTISDWASFRRQMPVRHTFKISKLTRGKIPFAAFRVYLHPDDCELEEWLTYKE